MTNKLIFYDCKSKTATLSPRRNSAYIIELRLKSTPDEKIIHISLHTHAFKIILARSKLVTASF